MSTYRRRSLTALVAAAALAALATFVPATSASAHSELISASPAEDSTVNRSPSEVKLVFGETVQADGSEITVRGSNGSRYDQANTFATNANIATVQLDPAAPDGDYTVSYRVVSADGHVVEESYTYTVAASTSPSPTTPATSSASDQSAATTTESPADDGGDSSGTVVWVLGLGAIGIVLVAALIAVAVRGRRDGSD